MTVALPTALIEALRNVANLIADGEWEILGKVAPSSRVRWSDVARVRSTYGKTFVHLPVGASGYMDGIRITDRTWDIRCPLWTLEEGRSDLEMQATAREVFDGIWQVDVDDVLVP
jgi:hypothetical protein